MSQYLVVKKIQVQNANCIAGFTWGFPAVTHFLGFTHHIERQIRKEFDVSIGGCAIVCHDTSVHCYQPQPGRDFEFIQSKNPPYLPKHKLEQNAPIVEEGRMNMTVSLVIKLKHEFAGSTADKERLEERLIHLFRFGRLAGGTILDFYSLELKMARGENEDKKLLRDIKRKLMPGFVLRDRSELLEQHFSRLKEEDPEVELLDAWLDFSALKYEAVPDLAKPDDTPNENTGAEWLRCEKPFPTGWLVPLMVGYKAISSTYEPGEVSNVRDQTVPSRFVEAVHSVGEWQSLHRIRDIGDVIWHYSTSEEWYLCKQIQSVSTATHSMPHQAEKVSFEDILATI